MGGSDKNNRDPRPRDQRDRGTPKTSTSSGSRRRSDTEEELREQAAKNRALQAQAQSSGRHRHDTSVSHGWSTEVGQGSDANSNYLAGPDPERLARVNHEKDERRKAAQRPIKIGPAKSNQSDRVIEDFDRIFHGQGSGASNTSSSPGPYASDLSLSDASDQSHRDSSGKRRRR